MASFARLIVAITVVLSFSGAHSQSIFPSNSTTDLDNATSSPRYLLGTSEVSNTPSIRLALLGPYVNVSYSALNHPILVGQLLHVQFGSSGQAFRNGQIAYILCDAFPDQDITPIDLLSFAISTNDARYVLLYSNSSDQCGSTNLNDLPAIGGIFTTVGDPLEVQQLTEYYNVKFSSPGTATILPDPNSFQVHSTTSATVMAPPSKRSVSSDASASHTSSSHSRVDAIVGAAVGGVAGLIISLPILYICLWRRRKSSFSSPPQVLTEKPEMYAGSVNQNIAGPVKPKHELRSQGTVQRKLLPYEKAPEKDSSTIEELEPREKAATAYPVGIHELSDGTQVDDSSKQESSLPETQSERATTETSKSTRGLLSSAPAQPAPALDSYSLAEADFAVQELGLISMRKRTLAEQAAAVGKPPEDIEGRAGDQI